MAHEGGHGEKHSPWNFLGNVLFHVGKINIPGQLQIPAFRGNNPECDEASADEAFFKLLLKYDQQVQLRKKKPNSVISGINDFNYNDIKHACK